MTSIPTKTKRKKKHTSQSVSGKKDSFTLKEIKKIEILFCFQFCEILLGPIQIKSRKPFSFKKKKSMLNYTSNWMWFLTKYRNISQFLNLHKKKTNAGAGIFRSVHHKLSKTGYPRQLVSCQSPWPVLCSIYVSCVNLATICDVVFVDPFQILRKDKCVCVCV